MSSGGFPSRVALLAASVVVVFDVVASLVSKATGLDYASLFWISFLIYGAAGFAAARATRALKHAAGAGAVVAAVEATVGWAASYAIEPRLYDEAGDLTLPIVLVTVALVVASGGVLGVIGGFAGRRFAKRA